MTEVPARSAINDGVVVRESLERRLNEFAPLLGGDTLLDAVAVAIAVESTFDIVLGDDDIAPERLCSADALMATVIRYLDGA